MPAGCHSIPPSADHDSQGLRPSGVSDAGLEVRLPAHPAHSSSPKWQMQPTWSEVVHRSRRAPSPPRLSHSNHFSALRDVAATDPVAAPAPSLLDPDPAKGAPSFAVVAQWVTSTDQAAWPASTGMLRSRLLSEAVSRCSEGRPWASDTLTPPAPSAPAHRHQQLPSSAQVERSTSAGSSARTSPPPLFPPTTLIIGDSITRYIRFFNSMTHCFPGATVPVILDKLLHLLPSLPFSISKIVLHVGSNDTSHSQS
ncbi:Stonustoxin subunit alpha [Xyrichtys novacula]|uniref:Stonustoxin subunit alpha n=1 Tax=Xyrichtys novacula TaxID=13765 RepID=A0AAV1GEM6_XYRNO|nr:Stonustoxin subunit alpha [Xyrichtys novacula]